MLSFPVIATCDSRKRYQHGRVLAKSRSTALHGAASALDSDEVFSRYRASVAEISGDLWHVAICCIAYLYFPCILAHCFRELHNLRGTLKLQIG